MSSKKQFASVVCAAMVVASAPSTKAQAQNAPPPPPAAQQTPAPAPNVSPAPAPGASAAPATTAPARPTPPPPPPPPGATGPVQRFNPGAPQSSQMPFTFQQPVISPQQLNTPGIHVAMPASVKVTGVAARVGSVVITDQQLVERFLADGGQATLNDLIYTSMIEQEAKKQNVSLTHNEVLREYNDFKRQMLASAPPGMTWAQLLTQQSRSEEYALEQVRLRLLLQKLMAKAAPPLKLAGKRHFYHILLVTTPITGHSAMKDADALAKVKQIAADVAANKMTFRDAARMYTNDDLTRSSGGDLGWLGQGEGLDPTIEKAAFALKEGEVSAPVKTQYGYELIYAERFGEHATPSDIALASDAYRKQHQSRQDLVSYVQQLKQQYQISNFLLPGVPLPASMGGSMSSVVRSAPAAKPASTRAKPAVRPAQ